MWHLWHWHVWVDLFSLVQSREGMAALLIFVPILSLYLVVYWKP
jgi:hypothetical protein